MNVYFFEFWQYTPHLETAFELAKKHLDAGDEVWFYFGGHELGHGNQTYRSDKSLLVRTGLKKLPERVGADLLRGERFHFFPHMDLPPVVRYWDDSDLSSIEHLFQVKYEQYNAGLSVISSLVSETRCSAPDLRSYMSRVNRMLEDGARVYDFVSKNVKLGNAGLVYVFNGRFYEYRAVLDAVRSLDVPVLIHERGATKERYSLRNCMPHDRIRIQEEVLASWRVIEGDPDAERIAHGFFQDRRQGVEQSWKSFVSGQLRGRIPELPAEKKIVSYFSSSDDEYVAVGDIYKWEFWSNQYEAVVDLIDLCAAEPEYQLVIRIHPHLVEKSDYDREKWMALSRFSDVIVIPPESNIDTYALIQASDVVIVANSTVGIESVYWGTPAVNLGPSLYSELKATYQPRGRTELAALLSRNDLQADSNKALPYGYYMATFGIEFEYYRPSSLSSGLFMGESLNYTHPLVPRLRAFRRWFGKLSARILDYVEGKVE